MVPTLPWQAPVPEELLHETLPPSRRLRGGVRSNLTTYRSLLRDRTSEGCRRWQAGCMYNFVFGRVLRLLPAEPVHDLTLALLSALARVPGLTRLLASRLRPRDPVLQVEALGLTFPGPLGLAAGFDKEARAYRCWAPSASASSRSAPSRARLSRAIRSRGCSGCPRTGRCSTGWASTTRDRRRSRARLRGRDRADGVVGVNIGKTKPCPPRTRSPTTCASAERVAPHADYVVVNVSSPEHPGPARPAGGRTAAAAAGRRARGA